MRYLHRFLAVLTLAIGLTVSTASAQTYYPPAIGDFDGSNDQLTRSSGLAGSSNSKKGIVSFWVRWDGKDGETQSIIHNQSSRFLLFKTSSNKFRFLGKTGGGTIIYDQSTASAFTASSTWRHFLASWDLAIAASHVYVNDVSDADAPAVLTNNNIDYTQGIWGIAASPTGGSKTDGALAEVYFFPGVYLDFSIEVNRRLFIDDEGYPVSLGESGYLPTGTAPHVYMQTQYNNGGENSGTGGDFIIVGSPTYTEGPVPYGASGYTNTPTAGSVSTEFNGTDEALNRASFLSAADSKVATMSFWFRMDGGDGAYQSFLSGDNSVWSVFRHTNDKIYIQGWNATEGTLYQGNSTSTYLADSGWHHALFSVDLATQTSYLWIDGVDELVEALNIDGTLDWTVPAWTIGDLVIPAWPLDGAISEMYLDTTTYTNFSVEANRLLFADADGVPIDLGQTGTTPTGSQPIVYMFNRYNNIEENSGYGGDFTPAGSPSASDGPVPLIPGFCHAGGSVMGGIEGRHNVFLIPHGRGRGRMH